MKSALPAPGEVRKPPSWSNLSRRARLLGLTFTASATRSRNALGLGRYQIKDGATVLAGEAFQLTLNHVEYYIAQRERLVNSRERALSRHGNAPAHNEEGSAEAATSPSRGSNNPVEENAVNEQHDTTVPASPAMPDFEKAFYDLEELIDIVRRRVKTLEFLVDGIDGRAITQDPYGPVSVYPEERDALHSTARDSAWAVEELSRRFGSVVAQVVLVENVHGLAQRRRAKTTNDLEAGL